jgi:predicted dehydrogenase
VPSREPFFLYVFVSPEGPPLDEQYAKCDDFLRAIIEGRPPLVDPEDACHAVEILDAAYRSIQDGRIVHLSELQ